jgi:ribosomal protein L11 methyltransferase
MKWIELSVQVHPEAVDAVSNVFREYGTGGVAIEQAVRADPEGEERPIFEGLPVVKAYIPAGQDAPVLERRIEEALWHLQAFDLSPVGPLQRREVDEEDWAESWKEHFHPLKIGRVVIKPTWRDWDPAPDDIIVEIDPGMAFGTGLHPTTHLMLLALQDAVRPNMRVLDLGTGSGILAIAAAKLGAEVTALDISEVAVNVATENVGHNRLESAIRVDEGSIERVAGERYDVVFANIIASVLIDLARPLADSLKPDGRLLASGIIEDRADAVRAAFAGAGLTSLREEREGDWWLFVAQRGR